MKQRYRAFRQRSLADVINPLRVKPEELYKLEYIAGPGLFTNHGWIWKEALRLLALSGLKIATSPTPPTNTNDRRSGCRNSAGL
ncbi:hypothetical protein [Spirosoma telluris]|uniref:hypothetical protein n=1 Tax=Spirosoma telluris TaxID=2183553 RepID=UPI0018DCE6D8